jgi:large subunit ribosomal protein L19
MNQIIQEIEKPLIKTNLPELNVGDTVKVFVKIIKRRGSGVGKTITVRRVFQGVGIERVFLIHSPRIEKIAVQRRGHVRRSKLYYLRQRTGKATRIKEKVGARKELMAANAAERAAEKAAVAAEKAAAAAAKAEAAAATSAE